MRICCSSSSPNANLNLVTVKGRAANSVSFFLRLICLSKNPKNAEVIEHLVNKLDRFSNCYAILLEFVDKAKANDKSSSEIFFLKLLSCYTFIE